MSEKHGGFLKTAFPPRVLVLALSFLSSSLAVILAAACFALALDKRSDPNGAISLPSNQKFATFFTAGVFLAILPIPLIIFLSTWVHTRQRYTPSNPGSRSKVYELVTLQGLSLPPAKPFLFMSSTICRSLLALAIFVQLIDAIGFTIVVCIRHNTDICLYHGRVVLCNLLTTGQKLGVVIPGFVQISAQIILFFVLKSYIRSLEFEAQVTSDVEIFAPLSSSLKGGKRSQGPFQMVPGFDPDQGDLEKDGDFTHSFNSQPYDPAYDYATPYDDPLAGRPKNYSKQTKLSRSVSSSSGSLMQGPRPAPKRSGTILSYAPTSVGPSEPASPRKSKEWFKRFKSKTIDSLPADDEDANEAEGLVSGSGRTRIQRKKSNFLREREQDVDADGEDEEPL